MSDAEEVVESDSDSDESVSSDSSDSEDDTNSGDNPNTSEVTPGNANDETDSEEDEVVKAIRREREKSSEHPPDIHVEDYVVDISFSPTNPIIALATITGDVLVYKYTNESVEVVNTLELHTKACRDIEFSEDGETLFSSSKDKSIMLSDVNTGKLKQFYDNAHEEPVYSLLVMDENMLASGDDGGTVKLWDIRQKEAICSVKEVDDYVSCMITTEVQKYLVCASGEGCITSIDLATQRLHIQSEMYEHELTCMATVKNESKLLVGSANGVTYVFNWGEFGYHSDEYPGPKQAINCMVPITENIVVNAGEDGVLRGVHFFPQRHLGVVGQHRFTVESLDISHDGEFIASCSSDQVIKFWNIRYFEEITVDGAKKAKKREMNHNLPSSKHTNASDFFSGLA